MTGMGALDLLMGRLNRTSSTLRANALLEMNQVQDTLEEDLQLLPWFLLSEDATTSLTVGERRVAVPDDFLCEHEESMLLTVDDQDVQTEVVKGTYDELIQEFTLEAEGETPLKYALIGRYFVVFPLPTVAKEVKLSKYFARDDDITDNSATNGWLTHASRLIIGETGLKITALYVKDQDLAAFFAAEATQGRIALNNAITAREEANISRRMG